MGPGQTLTEGDSERAVVPKTGWRRQTTGSKFAQSHEGEEIGEVLDFILLESFVLFHTHTGRAFASEIHWDADAPSISAPIKILPPDSQPFITSIQGSFRSFALYLRSGAVLNATQDTIRHGGPFTRIPALQSTGVISLAFGDYHFLALHKAGHITSHGTESQSCGSLGLGATHSGESHLRGLLPVRAGGDAKLVPHAYTNGRRVWFEPEKREWLKHIQTGGADPREAAERGGMMQELRVRAEVSEWIEQEGNAWEQRFGDGGEPPYFALSVTAAGWHSGALVLVDEEAAERTRRGCWERVLPGAKAKAQPLSSSVEEEHDDDGDDDDDEEQQEAAPQGLLASLTGRVYGALGLGQRRGPSLGYRWRNDPFPRLELSNGRVMPGTVEVAKWREGRPDWDLTFTPYS